MKKFSLILAALLITVAASAQSWSSEWVPKHEFHIDAFGGISALNYTISPGFAPNATKPMFPDRLGGGAGLGYTLHFNEYWGLTTGAEFAIYRGSFFATGNPWTFVHLDKSANPNDPGVGLVYFANIKNNVLSDDQLILQENQTLYTAQVPLMVQFMAPLNAKKSNHFYLALGARFLFNVKGGYQRSFDGFYGDKYMVNNNGVISYTDGKQGVLGASGTTPGTTGAAGGATISSIGTTVDATVLYDNSIPRQQRPLSAEEAQALLNDKTSGLFIRQVVTNPTTDFQTAFGEDVGANGELPGFNKKGTFDPKLFNVAASGELGFRWGLGNGWGLYTGLYVDYGFLSPLDPQTSLLTKVNDDQGTPHYAFSDGPIVGMTYDDVSFTVTPKEGDPSNYYITATGSTSAIASKFSNLGAGLKLKLAFGKVNKKPAEPQIIYVDKIIRDTVVKTNTVTVRDTVVKTNTVIQKEIIRDTVTIIKEVPVEIKQTMAELSNTMFDFDKSIIKEEAKGPLNKVVAWLQENPTVKVEISGHTDSKGSDEYNQKLSEARAKAVYEYFISQGVDKFRLAYAGYGESRPIATNETDAGRQLNRRVELNIIQ